MIEPWTRWVDNMFGLDFETTGIDVSTDRIVTASAVTIAPPADPSVREWLVNPGVDIPAEATAVHGVTTEQARADGCEPREAITAIVGGLRNAITFGCHVGQAVRPIPVVVFNASYDLSILHAECVRHGIEPLSKITRVIDPLVIDKLVDKFRPGKRTLTAMCATYGVKQSDAHQSTGDVMATLRLAWAMAKRAERAVSDPDAVSKHYNDRRYPMELVQAWQQVGTMTIDQLHVAQAQAAADQAESFAEYLRGQGERERAEMVDGSWPVRRSAVPDDNA
jgi:DNA polymerase-3 subunit epsilon